MAISAANLSSEFIGTYLLVLTVGCNVLGGSPIFAALSIASVLMVAIYALGSVSGAHFNPAVSFALFVNKQLGGNGVDATTFGAYAATQLIAGACAGFTYTSIYGESINLSPIADGHKALTAEALYTFMLCFVVLRCAVEERMNGHAQTNEFYGLAIGFVIVAGGYAAGPLSMGAFNPAVAFGLDISSATKGFHWCIWYSLVELLGAGLAAGAAQLVKGASGKFVSEFLGTFFLVLTVGLNVLTMSPAAALSIGASLTVMIYALADVSGAHFNPAVTAAITLAKKADAKDAAPYMAAQFLGGLVAGQTYAWLAGGAFPLAPGSGYSWADAAFAEIVYTFVLCFTVLSVAFNHTEAKNMSGGAGSKEIYGFAIGSCITVGGFAIGGISGGSLNPAVSFGIDTAYAVHGGSWMNCLPYSGFEFVGAAVAAGALAAVGRVK